MAKGVRGKAELVVIPRSRPSTRKIVDAVFKAGAGTQGLGEGEVLEVLYATDKLVSPPFNMDAFADMYERNDTVGACVDQIVENVVGMGLEVISKEKPRSGSDVTASEPATEEGSPEEREWLRGVFEEANAEGLMPTEVLRRVMTDYQVVGQGYLEITRNGKGRISGLHHLAARTMRVRLDDKGRIDGYAQVVGEKTRHFRKFQDTDRRFAKMQTLKASDDMPEKHAEAIRKAKPWLPTAFVGKLSPGEAQGNGRQELSEVMVWRKYSPRRGIYGVPSLAAVFEDVIGIANYKLFNADWFENGTIPPGLVTIKGGVLARTTRDQLKKFFESETRQEYHRLALLAIAEDTVIEIQSLTDMQMKEGAYTELAEDWRKAIAARYRVPYSMISESRIRAPGQAEQDAIRFREQTVRPDQRMVMGQINGRILADMGVKDWEVKLLQGDLTEMTARAQACERGVRAGALSPDQYLATVHNFPPMPNGAGEKAFKTIPGVGAVPTEEIARGGGIVRKDRGVAATDKDRGEAAGRLRDAAEKAGIDLDEDDAYELAEALIELEVV